MTKQTKQGEREWAIKELGWNEPSYGWTKEKSVLDKVILQAHQQGYKEAVERIKLKLLGTDEEMERLWKNERGGLKEFVFNLRERQLRILAELEGKKGEQNDK